MKYQIKNPKKMNKNTLRGFFTLAFGPLEISRVGLLRGKGTTCISTGG